MSKPPTASDVSATITTYRAPNSLEVSQAAEVQFVDEKTLSVMLGLSQRTLQDWRTRRGGGPPFYRFGRSIRYHLDEALAWARHQRKNSTW